MSFVFPSRIPRRSSRPDSHSLSALQRIPFISPQVTLLHHSVQIAHIGLYIDLSGWSPKYFPEILIQYINTRLQTKMLFGSDYPLITPERWLSDFEKLAIKDEVRPLIIKGNAAKLFGLE